MFKICTKTMTSLALLMVFSVAAMADDKRIVPSLDYSTPHKPVIAQSGMVVSQDIYASDVGRDILMRGGNAVDAAVATGFALAVTHQQAGNLAGGGFMLLYLADQKKTIAIDYRERAPKAAYRDMFLDEDGNYDRQMALYSGRSTGVPGTVRGLLETHEAYGVLTREEVISPAIRLAKDGFPMTPALYHELKSAEDILKADPGSRKYFFKEDGSLYQPGDLFVQADLARVLQEISDKGAEGFYQGWVAERLLETVNSFDGLMSEDDLTSYEVVTRAPITDDYKGYQVVSMPPPSSGGVHIIQMMNILSGYDLQAMGHNSADYLHVLIESMRRAYADRSKYLGDPDFADVPEGELTSDAYAERLRESINMDQASRSADIAPGMLLSEGPNTTHFSVVDRHGNAVSNTYTLNWTFGNARTVMGGGFLLNNEMDDFSSKPGTPNAYGLIGSDANAIEPLKRPLSSMTPVIALKDGEVYLVTGAPGGSTIINTVFQTVMNILEFDMNPAEATAMPRIHHQWLPDLVYFEKGFSADTLTILRAKGQPLANEAFWSGSDTLGVTQTIVRGEDGTLQGAADPRGFGSKASGY